MGCLPSLVGVLPWPKTFYVGHISWYASPVTVAATDTVKLIIYLDYMTL